MKATIRHHIVAIMRHTGIVTQYVKERIRSYPFVAWCRSHSLAAVLIAALVVRLLFYVGLGYHDDFTHAKFVYRLLQGCPERPVWYDGTRPGIYLPMTLFAWLLGYNEFVLSLFFLLCSLGCVALAFLIAERLSSKSGVWAAWAMAVFPVDVIFSTQYGPDMPIACASGLAVLCALSVFRADLHKRHLWAACLGMSLGWGYAVKETVVLMVPVLVIASITARPSLFGSCKAATALKSVGMRTAVALFAFVLCVAAYNLYFRCLFGEWLLGERIRYHAFITDGNRNDDLMFYVKAMLNCEGQRWQFQHNLAYYGWMYYAFGCSIVLLLVLRQWSFALPFVWWGIGFIFFEWGLGWLTGAAGYGIAVRISL